MGRFRWYNTDEKICYWQERAEREKLWNSIEEKVVANARQEPSMHEPEPEYDTKHIDELWANVKARMEEERTRVYPEIRLGMDFNDFYKKLQEMEMKTKEFVTALAAFVMVLIIVYPDFAAQGFMC